MNLLLLSGGMDSSSLVALLKPARALVIDYGQVCAQAELVSAQLVAGHYGVPLDSIRLDARALGGGTMAGRAADDASPCPEWWPFRNQFLLTVAAMHAYRWGAQSLLIGAVASDGEAHADGRAGFFTRMSALLGFQEGGITIDAPAISLSTAELVKLSGIPMSILAGTHSCHVSNLACGNCRGCNKREAVLFALGQIKV